ncbi:hypothetical protein SAY87_028289 [Trapa incisa]|uniref:L-ascorbate peroxidase n=1 Tax=Trapa incisa TaxID=236973 RepID=A0AAN7QRW9_9MYRT|nr:hypothetical protein SAY87_028289 [Trapa incisa]
MLKSELINLIALRRTSLYVPSVFYSGVASPKCAASAHEQLKKAREDVKELLKTNFCHPILISSFDMLQISSPQLARNFMTLFAWDGMVLELMTRILRNGPEEVEPMEVSDLRLNSNMQPMLQAGGPKIPMKYGKVDVSEPEECPEEGRLPDAGPPLPANHLYLRFPVPQEIVALSGAHTLGRSRPDRSGWGKPETKYTD